MSKRTKKKDQTNDKTEQPKAKAGFLREYGPSIGLAVLLALLIRSSVVQAYYIPSGSMLETLEIGDQVLVSKIAYDLKFPFTNWVLMHTGEFERGDIIVFLKPKSKDDLIKRVIGLPGDEIRIADKEVYVNGEKLNEPYVRHTDPHVYPAQVAPRDNLGPFKVPEGKLFVMGDNRDYSADSRFWGYVPMKAVRGKARFRHWSWDKNTWSVRWSRLFTAVR